MRLAMERHGIKTVFSCDINADAIEVYGRNFGGEIAARDIREIQNLPPHDILCAGFPCQPHSIAGVSKNRSLGRPIGFEDRERGDLFWEIVRLLRLLPEEDRPRAILGENVPNLLSTGWPEIERGLRLAGYPFYGVFPFEGVQAGLAQTRPRIYIIATRNRTEYQEFIRRFEKELQVIGEHQVLGDILEDEPKPGLTLSSKLWEYLKKRKAQNRQAGKGFGYRLVYPWEVAPTLSARYYKDGSEILVASENGSTPRRLSALECGRLMGFPDEFWRPESYKTAVHLFGNAVLPPVIGVFLRALGFKPTPATGGG